VEVVNRNGNGIDEVVFKGKHFNVVFIIDLWKLLQFVHACVQVLQLGVVADLHNLQRIPTYVQPLEARQKVVRKGLEAVGRKVDFLDTDEVHVAEGRNFILVETKAP
jgi:hypothetical protein